MRINNSIVSMTLLAALGMAMAGAGVSAAPQNSAANWVRQPTALDIMGLYPEKARAKGQDGSGVIECIVTVEGSLRACKIKSESPEGLGFGQAALAMAPQFQMKPEIRDGAPVEIRVDIPIRFTGPGVQTGSHIAGSNMEVGQKRVLTGMRWTTTPTYADVAALFPAKAKAAKIGGKATIECTFKDAGRIDFCGVLNEEPAGYGFGNAARQLASHFQGPETFGDGKPTKGNFTTIPVVFPPGMGDGSGVFITQPAWLRTPSPQMYAARFPLKARQAGVASAHVVLGCTVGQEGELTQCAVNKEEPAALGFGEAVLSMAPVFLMRKWTEDGQAMIGRRINLPIGYQMNIKTDPPSAAVPAASPPTP